MRVGILGIGYFTKGGRKLMEAEIDRLLSDPKVEEIVFGTDSKTELYAINYAIRKREGRTPRLTGFIFDDMLSLPLNKEELLKKLDYIEELRIEDRYSFEKLISLCRRRIAFFSDKMIVFWDGNFSGLTYELIEYIRGHTSKKLSIINVVKK